MTKVIYKIRNKNTGLFSAGGLDPKWTKNGKTWSEERFMVSHLREYYDYKGYIPDCWEIIQIKMQIPESGESAKQLYQKKLEEKAEQKKEEMKQYYLNRRKEEYEEAKAIVEAYEGRKSKIEHTQLDEDDELEQTYGHAIWEK